MTSPPVPTRAEFEREERELLNRGGARNPDVYRIDRDGRCMVVKDFSARSPWVRATIGRWVSHREARAWKILTGHPNVPDFVGWIDPLAFAVEYREGRPMRRKLASEVPDDFADQLDAALAEMHHRGVVHLDLRHRSNVMLGKDGAPILIDFGSAFCFSPGGWAARWILPWLARIDLQAARKWREKLAGGGVS